MAQPHDNSGGKEPKCFNKGCMCCTKPKTSK